jgi:hypothetical protein
MNSTGNIPETIEAHTNSNTKRGKTSIVTASNFEQILQELQERGPAPTRTSIPLDHHWVVHWKLCKIPEAVLARQEISRLETLSPTDWSSLSSSSPPYPPDSSPPSPPDNRKKRTHATVVQASPEEQDWARRQESLADLAEEVKQKPRPEEVWGQAATPPRTEDLDWEKGTAHLANLAEHDRVSRSLDRKFKRHRYQAPESSDEEHSAEFSED